MFVVAGDSLAWSGSSLMLIASASFCRCFERRLWRVPTTRGGTRSAFPTTRSTATLGVARAAGPTRAATTALTPASGLQRGPPFAGSTFLVRLLRILRVCVQSCWLGSRVAPLSLPFAQPTIPLCVCAVCCLSQTTAAAVHRHLSIIALGQAGMTPRLRGATGKARSLHSTARWQPTTARHPSCSRYPLCPLRVPRVPPPQPLP